MDDSGNMRISLPPGTILKGQREAYKVDNIICLSERSVTVSCSDRKGRKFRLKFYNGDTSITEEIQSALNKLPMQGVVLPVDIGDYSGMRFGVFPQINSTSTDLFPVSISTLTTKIIPQLSYLINQYHKSGIILRDICPSHILYKPDEEKIAFSGFNNAALLRGKATITKEKGYGQEHSYIAPEVAKYGYSIWSDYFSLGTTILTILKGRNPIEKVKREDFIKQLMSGIVPGIDVAHLRTTPFELYSAEDKVSYLVLGLMIPNPKDRWGYGEIRCWLNGQKIPLVQKGERVKYEFDEPFSIGNLKCWNCKQLSIVLAKSDFAWTEDTVRRLIQFTNNKIPSLGDQIAKYVNDSSVTSSGKLFRFIYTLYPQLDGLWWKGKKYKDTFDIVMNVQNMTLSNNQVSEMLTNGVFSFFEDIRFKINIGSGIGISEIKEVERIERQEAGKGVQRFLMLFSSDSASRCYEFEGSRYKSIYDFLLKYKNDGGALRNVSCKLLKSQSFQAWLWAKGRSEAGEEAKRIAENAENQSLYMLLSLCENIDDDVRAKKLARMLFLKWGDFSPIVWLCSNVKFYNVISASDQNLYEVFKNTKFSTEAALEELSQKANALVSDYQIFVSRTLDNPFVLENENLDDFNYGYYPQYESGYFCCDWINGLEVCPAFIKTTGGKIDPNVISAWLKTGEDDETKRLQEKLKSLPSFNSSDTDEVQYLNNCNKNIGFGIFMLVIVVILLVLARNYSIELGVLAFATSVLFPINAILWYAQRKNNIDLWIRNKNDVESRHTFIEDRIQNVKRRSMEIFDAIQNGRMVETKKSGSSINIVSLNLDNPDTLELNTWQKLMAYVSTYGYVMMATIVLGNIYASFLSATIYAVIYGIVAPNLLNRKRFVNSCFSWSVTTLIVTGASIFGGVTFGNLFFVTMNWITVVCLIAIVAFWIFTMFL